MACFTLALLLMRGMLCDLGRWMLGKQYPVVPNSIYFMSLRDWGKLEQLVQWQKYVTLTSTLHVGPQARPLWDAAHALGPNDFKVYLVLSTYMQEPSLKPFASSS